VSLLSLVSLGYRKGLNNQRIRGIFGCLCVVFCVFFGLGAAGAQTAGAKELRVAAAADLQSVMPALAAAYEHATGIKLAVSYGSSGTLATQIINGAPMDLFLGADYSFPEKLVAAGLADGTTPTPYAMGTLVLWARKDSPLQPLSMELLTDPRVKSIAIANEEHAPYGRAAVAALRHLKLYDATSPHFVIAENISQTAQFVESGNAQLGLISLTAASSEHFKEIGTYVLVPTTAYPPILQCAVIMVKSERKAEAHAFLDWLLSTPVQENLKTMGLRSVK
jgi:molybdate transport system substrate-binding protein